MITSFESIKDNTRTWIAWVLLSNDFEATPLQYEVEVVSEHSVSKAIIGPEREHEIRTQPGEKYNITITSINVAGRTASIPFLMILEGAGINHG